MKMTRTKTFSQARAYGGLSVPLRAEFEFEKLLPSGPLPSYERCSH
jgi:hypothetical protein